MIVALELVVAAVVALVALVKAVTEDSQCCPPYARNRINTMIIVELLHCC